jgi:hypothetical protein
MRFIRTIVTLWLAVFWLGNLPAFARSDDSITLKLIGRYTAPGGIERAEIAAYDAVTKRIFAINGSLTRVDVLDISNPAVPELQFTIPLNGRPNSVAVRDGVVAVAVENSPKTSPGWVQFFDVHGTPLNTVMVGALPDMLTFTPDGQRVLVANEGEPSGYRPDEPGDVDPEGSVSIIKMSDFSVKHVLFNNAIPKVNTESIRIYGPNATLAQDLEPEYITISEDSKTAWVTLQENNAIAILDIEKGDFSQLVGLGFKDHSRASNRLDASDRDGGINIAHWPVFGMYLPDAIASYRVNSETFLVLANEGDTRNWEGFSEEIRVGSSDFKLDPKAFPTADKLKLTENLGRLTVTNTLGAKEADADDEFEKIFVPGARSFSIRTSQGQLIFDSGDDFEKTLRQQASELFNSDGTPDSLDTRSDNKGPEPEAVVVAPLFGRQYAFIGLERAGGVMIYDVSDPSKPFFVDYVNTSPDDLAPEGLFFIRAEDSPNGKPLLVISHEISSTTTIMEIIDNGKKPANNAAPQSITQQGLRK